MENIKNKMRKGAAGRKPKPDPCSHRYAFNLNDEDNAKFLALFDASGLHCKARFITSCIFGREIKVVKIDKSVLDVYMRLTTLHSQYRAIGVNYNQITKAIKTNFGEKRGLSMLYSLEKETIQLVVLTQEVKKIIDEFEEKWLRK